MEINFDHFDAYLAKHVSESNRKSCVRVIKKLASGEGVTHKNKPGKTFLGGHTLTLSDDIASIQKQAAVWLPFRKGDPNCLDLGHGWALNHPLSWLGKFKASIKDADSDSEDDQVLLSDRHRAHRVAPTARKPEADKHLSSAERWALLKAERANKPNANRKMLELMRIRHEAEKAAAAAAAVPLSAKQVHEKIAKGVPVVAAVQLVKKPTPPPKRKREESDASKMAEELRKEKEKNKKLERELRQFKKKKSEDGAAAASKTADDDQGVEIACGIRIEELD